jgi:hypothetical protein
MADKTKTIKGASDQELDDLIKRLRKEGELQRLISDLKRNAQDGYPSYDQCLGVSAETPIDKLYHWGIMGMRWGRKKGRKSTKASTSSSEHKNKEILKKKKLSDMTNSELKTFNERLQLERSYKELRSSEISPGRKFIQEMLVTTGKQAIQSYLQKHATDLVKKFL